MLFDEAMDSHTLAEWVPVLQTSARLDAHGCDRLMRSLVRGNAAAGMCQYLAYGRITSELSDGDITRLLRAIADKHDGLLVALDVLAHGRCRGRGFCEDVSA
ncbi:hypothetical protein [Dokdonella soli]|uniref:Uncharacterized protein n=1 Tax=Dokdonella soli TaxID=529810 RepID=A0ABP3TK01_9GAMM